MREEKFLAQVHEQAEKVRRTGRDESLWPMNACFRCLVHHANKGGPVLGTESDRTASKLKSIRLYKK